MRFLIIGDSSMDLNDELKQTLHYAHAPFKVSVDEHEFTDEPKTNILTVLDAILSSKNVARSAAPAPMDYLEHVSADYDGVFFVALSSKLSGSYNSACLAKRLAQDHFPGIKIHVVDSMMASAGETSLAIHIHECAQKGMSFEETVTEIESYRDTSKLYFLLDNLETLVKNGRLNSIKGMIAALLKIKPIMAAVDGEAVLLESTRTYTRAHDKLAKIIADAKHEAHEKLVIAHCMAKERAELLKGKLTPLNIFKEIIIVPMGILSSTYANVGGMVVAV